MSIWYRKYIQLSHHHQQYLLVKSKIYRGHLGYGINSVWYETYIHLYLQHQLVLPDCKMKSGWDIVTYIHLYQHILCNYERNIGLF